MRLPDDLIAFLRHELRLDYVPEWSIAGKVRLASLGALRLGNYPVGSKGKEQARNDPNRRRRGRYVVPGVSLVAECEKQDPDGLLLWIPEEQSFGTWDPDHHDVWLFWDVSWAEIAQDPIPYLNGRWERDRVETEWLVPWPKYPFVEDDDFLATVPR